MELPIKFPSEAEVAAEEASRFRSLSDREQVHELGKAYRLYQYLRKHSGRVDEIDRLAEEEEQRGYKAILEFVRRHGHG